VAVDLLLEFTDEGLLLLLDLLSMLLDLLSMLLDLLSMLLDLLSMLLDLVGQRLDRSLTFCHVTRMGRVTQFVSHFPKAVGPWSKLAL
jgi:hypothetical protein